MFSHDLNKVDQVGGHCVLSIGEIAGIAVVAWEYLAAAAGGSCDNSLVTTYEQQQQQQQRAMMIPEWFTIFIFEAVPRFTQTKRISGVFAFHLTPPSES
jgi:hypothetical protein